MMDALSMRIHFLKHTFWEPELQLPIEAKSRRIPNIEKNARCTVEQHAKAYICLVGLAIGQKWEEGKADGVYFDY